MTKLGKAREYKISCTNCSSKFLATAEDFIMTRNVEYKVLTPMMKCPYCGQYMYRETGLIFEFWKEPYWEFEIAGGDERK